MLSKRRAVIGGALVLAVAAGGWAIYRGVAGPRVRVVPVSQTAIVQSLVVSGRVLAPAEVEIGPAVLARVEAVDVDVGDHVTAGQVLLRLDDDEVRAQVQQAEATSQRALAGARELRSVTSPVADDALEAARVNLQRAEQELGRMRTLVGAGALPRTQLDDAVRARDLARAELSSAAARASSTRRGGAASSGRAAEIAQAEAALVAARARLAEMTVRAPMDGVVLRRRVDPGTVVTPGQALLTIIADGEARLQIEPDESNLRRIAVGQPAVASADAFADRTFDARVSWIAPAVDPERGTVEVRLEVPEPPDYLRADMTVSVDIEVGRADSTSVAPAEAVHDAATDAPFVLVIHDGHAVRREVRLGLEGDDAYEILSGVEPGDLLVPADETAISSGDPVRPQIDREGDR